MDARRIAIARYHDRLLEACYDDPPDLDRANRLADLLEPLLGDRPQSERDYPQQWTLIWEARGRLDEAVRVAGRNIAENLTLAESGDCDDDPAFLRRHVEHLRDCLFLQALRLEKLGRVGRAIDALLLAEDVAGRYPLEPDEDCRGMYIRLMASVDNGSTAPIY